MKFLNKYLAILFIFTLTTIVSLAQDSTDVRFSFSHDRIDKNKVALTITAHVLKSGIDLYAIQKKPEDAVFTQINFDTTSSKYLNGAIDEKGNVQTKTDATLALPVNFVTDSIQWVQQLNIAENDSAVIKGKIAYIYKSGEEFPAAEKEFSIDIKTPDAVSVTSPVIQEDDNLNKSSLWELFLAGLVAGFIAFIMPCIYALLPITVGFFTKRSKNRATGIKNAVLYSLSIIFIFTAIGALVSLLFTEKTMYELSTSMGFNLFVFVLFVVFGISLLGAFEITLPASWSTKLDSKANSNSFGGIFFMALVLVVVSFSCTSAFISSLIVYIVKSGNSLGGVVGFLGFGLAIALPFALGAFFPSVLNNIAKSGGWLNSVKVTMGFLELAMAMKFLSNVDLQYHWRLLDFEVYLSIWIVIFGLLGLYLLGKLRLSHDDQLPKNSYGLPYLSVTRLFSPLQLYHSQYILYQACGARPYRE
uniref:Cytochrome C biogenesis protein transmembrane domain-containing protein n=1 Tax=Niabella ginsengisoli TaxID=522298 RepID=A0ABS9SL95_9BACT|nr:cytochrome c biogenesis protein CcdA [Niabella ginsengisoli]MCH5599080.1 hypothetical protein [Niabella ginsengisoli]